jgi:uncharacterized protein involved in tolerance to divalent cations
MTEFIEVRTTLPSQESAQKIGLALVSRRLAASAQLSAPISSSYWWKGEIVTAEERTLTVNTRHALYKAVEQAIRDLHPYEEPSILAFVINEGRSSFLSWIEQETILEEEQSDEAKQDVVKVQSIHDFDLAYEQLIKSAKNAAQRCVTAHEDEWGPSEVLAHIAGWAAQATAHIPQVLAGMPPIAYASEAQNEAFADTFNAAFITLLGNQSLEQVLTITDYTHQQFVAMLRSLDIRYFVPDNYMYERMRRVIDHHLFHARELDKLIAP